MTNKARQSLSLTVDGIEIGMLPQEVKELIPGEHRVSIVHLSPTQTRATLGLLSSLLCREPKQAAEVIKAKP